MGKILQRTCMGCNQKRNKSDLIRIVKNKKDEVNIDKTGKQDGRGAYICKKQECVEKAIKTKRIERVLEIKLTDGFYEKLKKFIVGGELLG